MRGELHQAADSATDKNPDRALHGPESPEFALATAFSSA
jgi:hypothetical protein